MTDTISAEPLLLAAVMAAIGVAFGLIYLRAVHRSVDAMVDGGWRMPLAMAVARLALAGGLLVLVAQLGALALLSTFAGFLVARTIVLRRARAAS